MEDRELVAAIVGRDPRGLAEAYQRYAGPLLTYCRWLLRDPDDAADAVHNTFVIANERVGQLRDPARLRPWLYAVARRECLSMRRPRHEVPLGPDFDIAVDTAELGRTVNAEQINTLVSASLAGLSTGDREALVLALRHDLSVAEVAAALGMSESHTRARLSRARKQLRRSLGALVVARVGQPTCEPLRAVLGGWGGEWTPLWCKRVSRHVGDCAVCTACEREHCDPDRMIAAFAGLPLLAVAAQQWLRIELTCADVAAAARVARRSGPLGRSGFPVDRERRRTRGLAAAAVVLLIMGVGVATVPQPGGSAATSAGIPPAQNATERSGSPEPTGPSGASAGPSGIIESGPTGGAPSGDPADPGTSPGPSGSPAPLVLVTRAQASCEQPHGFKIAIDVHAIGQPLKSATLGLYRLASIPMTITGGRATVVVHHLSGYGVSWRVTVVAVNGAQASTMFKALDNPC